MISGEVGAFAVHEDADAVDAGGDPEDDADGEAMRTKERPISQAAGMRREMRKYMSSGVQKGMSETTLRPEGVGVRDDDGQMSMQKASGMTRNMLSC